MINKIKRLFSLDIIFKLLDINQSYSQFGEDTIVANLLKTLEVPAPVYLDIGANDPRHISNTYLLYRNGGRGVLVEPNPRFYEKLKRIRKRDVVLNAGIGTGKETEGTFYLFPKRFDALNTFSEKAAHHWETVGMKGQGKISIEKTITIPLISMESIFHDHFKDKMPDFVNIDVEGLDLEILQTIDFKKHRPKVFCCESSYYDETQNVHKETEVIGFMEGNGYIVYADTFINTIFVDKRTFEARAK